MQWDSLRLSMNQGICESLAISRRITGVGHVLEVVCKTGDEVAVVEQIVKLVTDL
jgi:hypothetical protein